MPNKSAKAELDSGKYRVFSHFLPTDCKMKVGSKNAILTDSERFCATPIRRPLRSTLDSLRNHSAACASRQPSKRARIMPRARKAKVLLSLAQPLPQLDTRHDNAGHHPSRRGAEDIKGKQFSHAATIASNRGASARTEASGSAPITTKLNSMGVHRMARSNGTSPARWMRSAELMR